MWKNKDKQVELEDRTNALASYGYKRHNLTLISVVYLNTQRCNVCLYSACA